MHTRTDWRQRPERRWHHTVGRIGIGLACACLLAATAVTVAAPAGAQAIQHKKKSPPLLKLNKRGIPNLSGRSIPLGKGAGAPHVGDTVAFITEQLLKSWGANTSLTLGEGAAVVAAVVGGHLVATGGPFDAQINGGLTVFGPSQPGQDYEFITASSVKTLADLTGKVVAVSAPDVGDAVLTTFLLKKESLTGKVTIEYSGTESNSLAGFIGGRVQGFWASGDSVVALKQQHVSFNSLMSARVLASAEADSYEAATRSWLSTHFSTAEAIDLAWLYAAKIFNTDPSLWLNYASSYTVGSVPRSTEALDYAAYHSEDPWPDLKTAFGPDDVKANLVEDVQAGGITKLTQSASESAYADFGPWDAAWTAFKAHPKAYR